ncbi:hypothetical protein IAR50_007219 [Cryptococcus sp. DSM 104548]
MSYDATLPQISSTSATPFAPPRNASQSAQQQQSWDPAESRQSWGGYDWCDTQHHHQLSTLSAFPPPPPVSPAAGMYPYAAALQPAPKAVSTAPGSFLDLPYPAWGDIDPNLHIPSLVDSRSTAGSSVSLPNLPPRYIMNHTNPSSHPLPSLPLLNVNPSFPLQFLAHKTPPLPADPLPPAPVLYDTVPLIQRPVPPRHPHKAIVGDGNGERQSFGDVRCEGMPYGTFSVGGGGLWHGMISASGPTSGIPSPVGVSADDRRFSNRSHDHPQRLTSGSCTSPMHFGGIHFTDPFPPAPACASGPNFSSTTTALRDLNPNPISPSFFLPPPPLHSHKLRDYSPPTPPPGHLSIPRVRPLPAPFRKFNSYHELLHDRVDEYGARAMSMPLTHTLMLESERKKRLGIVVVPKDGEEALRGEIDKQEKWDREEEERLLRKEGLLSPLLQTMEEEEEEDEDDDEYMPLLTREPYSSPAAREELDDVFPRRASSSAGSGEGGRASSGRRAKRAKKAKASQAFKKIKKFLCTECNEGFTRKNDVDRHMQCKHSSELPWACPSCSRRFGRKDKMELHIEKDATCKQRAPPKEDRAIRRRRSSVNKENAIPGSAALHLD